MTDTISYARVLEYLDWLDKRIGIEMEYAPDGRTVTSYVRARAKFLNIMAIKESQ
jgi:hypothetical protein